MPYTYEYPRFALGTDAVVIAKLGDGFKVLLIQRKNEPFKGMWSLPGGFVDIDETCDAAVHRELEEETGVRGVELRRIDVFDAVHRDPRDRVLSVAYVGVVPKELEVKGQDDAADARWFDVTALPKLGFDHSEIIQRALSMVSK
ncbi:NUDIX hydrolase [Polluticoccus soli]|uniref:NUDIX hydrolase n=1 Tax=Polluticoccus soli TaxID=3034150 RepID=UPI0023E23C5B|nr:NUDIX hydrolase [Flavipsychrobacter sp. JY13-12]